jgi:hypothetical protein
LSSQVKDEQTISKNKNPIKDQWLEPSQGKQKGKAKERPKDEQLA